MNTRILFISAILFLTSCKTQPPVWRQTANWKIYKTDEQKGFSYPLDSLHTLLAGVLDADSIRAYLQYAQLVSKSDPPVWMGAWPASYETPDGKTHKVMISVYAGFFYDESSQSTFSLPKNMGTHWRAYLSNHIPN